MTHIFVSKLKIIASDNELSPARRQCWNVVNWNLRNKLQWHFNRSFNIFTQENAFLNVVWKISAIFSRPQCVNTLRPKNGIHFAVDVFWFWYLKGPHRRYVGVVPVFGFPSNKRQTITGTTVGEVGLNSHMFRSIVLSVGTEVSHLYYSDIVWTSWRPEPPAIRDLFDILRSWMKQHIHKCKNGQ